MRLPQLTTRRLMVLVAVVAIVFGGRDLLHRARAHRAMAQRLAGYERVARMKLLVANANTERTGTYSQKDVPRLLRLVLHIQHHRENYERAARFDVRPGLTTARTMQRDATYAVQASE